AVRGARPAPRAPAPPISLGGWRCRAPPGEAAHARRPASRGREAGAAVVSRRGRGRRRGLAALAHPAHAARGRRRPGCSAAGRGVRRSRRLVMARPPLPGELGLALAHGGGRPLRPVPSRRRGARWRLPPLTGAPTLRGASTGSGLLAFLLVSLSGRAHQTSCETCRFPSGADPRHGSPALPSGPAAGRVGLSHPDHVPPPLLWEGAIP